MLCDRAQEGVDRAGTESGPGQKHRSCITQRGPLGYAGRSKTVNGSQPSGRLSPVGRSRAVLLRAEGSSAPNAGISARPERQMCEALPGIQAAVGRDAAACGRGIATSPLMN